MRSSSGGRSVGWAAAARDDLAVGVQHLDADLEQVRVEVLDLLLGDLGLLQDPDDLVVGEEALLPPVGDERAHLLHVRQGDLHSAAAGRVRHRAHSLPRRAGVERMGLYGDGNRPRGASVIMDGRAHPAPRRSESPMSTTRRSLPDDLQQSLPAAPISLSRAGVTRSAKAIRIRHDGSRAALPGRRGLLLRPQPRPEGRAHVALRGGGQRGDRRRRDRRGADRRGAGGADRDQARGQPARPAQRGDDPRQLPGREADARSPASPPRRCTGSSGSPRPTPAPAGGSSGSPPRG